ncbi:biotin biosynthesis protein BioC [Pararhizobium gei]|uniref:biotin biosynthesis protein BioC n=1 Tax=Pararhizobium gei TaxID=1395951 RepID=UPI0023DB2EF9|nr:biotin biosynthesis protein BioC [Rhizobium gei]
MQIVNRLASGAAGDGLARLPGRTETQITTSDLENAVSPASFGSGYDPSSRVALSAEALLFLGRTRRVQEKYPPLTKEEWSNRLSPQLAAREYQEFGKYSETGDHKAYYRAFIEYFDNLRVEDQNSLRYFGTRDAAIAGARSLEYDEESGLDSGGGFQTLVSVILDTDKLQSEFTAAQRTGELPAGDSFGWDRGTITYEDVSQSRGALSEIEKFYQENF